MKIHKFDEKTFQIIAIPHLGALENTINIILDKTSKTACVIDPAWDVELILDEVTKRGFELTQIWLSHWHPDHTNGVDEMVAKTGAKVYAGINELQYLNLSSKINPLKDGDIISIGSTKTKIMHTPGHSRGAVSFILDKHFIAGDVLFVYGAGHCNLAGGDAKEHFQTMQRIKNEIEDNYILHCGHDYGSVFFTDMAEQKKHNPFLLIDNENDFVRYRNEIHDKTRKYPMSPMTKKQVYNLL